MKQSRIKDIYIEMLLSKKPQIHKNDSQANYIAKYLPSNEEVYVLDAGCGNGNYAFHLSSLGYKNIYAVDLFDDIKTDNFDYTKSSIEDLPFEANKFDFIYSNSVIHYLDAPEDGVKEFKRVLKENGILIFSAHTRFSLFTIYRILKRDVLKLNSMAHLKDINFYSAGYYRKLLEENGFQLILRDGYNLSFLIYPLYMVFARAIDRYVGISLPYLKSYMNDGIIGKIKSEIAYHSVFIARKI